MPFVFRHQPLKGLYWTFTVCVLLLVRLPLWTILYISPSARPRPRWGLGRSLIVSGLRVFVDTLYTTGFEFLKPPSLDNSAKEANKTGFVWVEACPNLVVGDIAHLATQNGVKAVRIGGFWYGERSADGKCGQKAAPNEIVFYHLHSKPRSPLFNIFPDRLAYLFWFFTQVAALL